MDHTQQAKQSRITIPRPRLFDVIGANEEMFLSDRGVYLRSVDPASIPRYTKHDSPPLSLFFSSSPHDPSWQIAFTIRAYDRSFPSTIRILVSFLLFFSFFFRTRCSSRLTIYRTVSCDLDIFTLWLKKRNTVEKSLELIKL